MKQSVFTIFLLVCLASALTGCGNRSKQETLEKAQEITVTDANGLPMRTITDQEEIEELTASLYPESWAPAELPEDAQRLGTLTFRQESTRRFWEESTDKILHQTAELTVYEGGFFCLDVGGVEMNFTVREEESAPVTTLFED